MKIADIIKRENDYLNLAKKCISTIEASEGIDYKAFLLSPYKEIGQDILDGHNVFILAPAGTGKSAFIVFIKKLLSMVRTDVYITSSTGSSAFALNGRTFHSALGIGKGDGNPFELYGNIRENYKTVMRLRKMNILLTDEISMIGAMLLDKVDFVLKCVRGFEKYIESQYDPDTEDFWDGFIRNEENKDTPSIDEYPVFGGIQCVFTGDFLQLPPVGDAYAFKSNAWNQFNFKYHTLEKYWRFENPKHTCMLNRIRYGKCTDEDNKILRARVKAYRNKEYLNDSGILPSRVFPINKNVNIYNANELKKLPGEVWEYHHVDTLVPNREKNKTDEDPIGRNQEFYSTMFDKQVPRVVKLKPGAQIILTFNVDTENGLTNGTKGVVVECLKDEVVCRFCNQEQNTLVQFNEWTIKDSAHIASRAQIPLKLSWALSSHKMQGVTSTGPLIVDAGSQIFAPGQSYVCLGRSRRLEDLYLIDFDRRKIIADPEALKFDRMVRKQNTITISGYVK